MPHHVDPTSSNHTCPDAIPHESNVPFSDEDLGGGSPGSYAVQAHSHFHHRSNVGILSIPVTDSTYPRTEETARRIFAECTELSKSWEDTLELVISNEEPFRRFPALSTFFGRSPLQDASEVFQSFPGPSTPPHTSARNSLAQPLEDSLELSKEECDVEARVDQNGCPINVASLTEEYQHECYERICRMLREASVDFVTRNSLHDVTDRGGNRIFFIPGGHGTRITSSEDLTLRQWSNQLCKVFNKRILTEAVNDASTFRVTMQGADELDFSVTKRKQKCDDDFLDAISAGRRFCEQLKDWQRVIELKKMRRIAENKIQKEKKRAEWHGFRMPVPMTPGIKSLSWS